MGNKFGFYTPMQIEQEKEIREKLNQLKLTSYYTGSRREFMPSEFSDWDRHDDNNISIINEHSDLNDYQRKRMCEIYEKELSMGAHSRRWF